MSSLDSDSESSNDSLLSPLTPSSLAIPRRLPRLPREVWAIIFRELAQPQTIVIEDGADPLVRLDYSPDDVFRPYQTLAWTLTLGHTSAIGLARRINHEGSAATAGYEPRFPNLVNGNGGRGVYFNGEKDILFFASMEAFFCFMGRRVNLVNYSGSTAPISHLEFDAWIEAHRGIRTIAIQKVDWFFHQGYFNLLASFPDLETIYLEHVSPDPEQFPGVDEENLEDVLRILLLNRVELYAHAYTAPAQLSEVVFIDQETMLQVREAERREDELGVRIQETVGRFDPVGTGPNGEWIDADTIEQLRHELRQEKRRLEEEICDQQAKLQLLRDQLKQEEENWEDKPRALAILAYAAMQRQGSGQKRYFKDKISRLEDEVRSLEAERDECEREKTDLRDEINYWYGEVEHLKEELKEARYRSGG